MVGNTLTSVVCRFAGLECGVHGHENSAVFKLRLLSVAECDVIREVSGPRSF